MIWMPRGTFRMELDKHYAEEAPVHRLVLQLGFILKFLHRKYRKLLVEGPDIPNEVEGTWWISELKKL